MRKALAYIGTLAAFCAVLASCKPSLPGDVLSKSDMTDILFDYHLAVAMAQNSPESSEADNVAYREAVLKKHGVTSAEFDSSMVYYMRHTELMYQVYKDLADRMEGEVVSMGGEAGGGDFDNLSATGDTANIWTAARSMVFSPCKGLNCYSFHLDADTAFHKGDRLRLDFESQFIYPDGVRDGIALLAVQFKNDSTAQSTVHIQSTQHYSIEVADNDSLGIKSVKGYFLLSDGGFGMDSNSSTTLKLMFLNRIRLIRMHRRKLLAPKISTGGDSAKVDTAKRRAPADSLRSPGNPPPPKIVSFKTKVEVTREEI